MLEKDFSELKCHLCQSKRFLTFSEFQKLGRATSDCKPWQAGGNLGICQECGTVQKIIDTQWRSETKQIYSEYQIYHQSENGQEQPIFDDNTNSFLPRSVAILNYLNQTVKLKANMKILDVGCGTGSMLKSMAKIYRNSSLYAFEPNMRHKEKIEQIDNVVDAYTRIDDIGNTSFGLLTMIHVLEHIDSPSEILKRLRKNIKVDGFFAVVVPDYTNNPFDLIIADHASHFSVSTLYNLLLRNGFKILAITNKVINKEIIAICTVDDSAPQGQAKQPTESNPGFVQKQLNWLIETARRADNLSRNSPFGIFGTSIAGNWIYGELNGKVDFFVDEDEDRTGKLYRSKPVFSVREIPHDSHVLVCLQPKVVDNIINRIASKNYKLHSPPCFL